jgi:hypothetical protein
VGEPARGYSWPQFEPGHTISLAHGANSERTLAPLAAEIERRRIEEAPWLASPLYLPAVRSLARCEAELELRWAWVDEHGLVDDDGNDRPGTVRLDRAEARAAKLREQLGLTPMATVRMLAGLSAVDGPAALDGLEALRQAGAAVRRAAEQRALTAATNEGEEVDDA